MSRNTKFKIQVQIDRKYFEESKFLEVIYCEKNDKSFTDKVSFVNNEVIIEGSRSKINIDKMLQTQLSTYYKVLIKSLLYVYFTFGEFTIKNIVIKVGKNEKSDTIISHQMFSKQIPMEYSGIETKGLVENLEVSDNTMNVMMYLVQSIVYYEEFRFENLWKAFNILIREYSEETRGKKEFDRLISLRKNIEDHVDKFSRVLEYGNSVDTEFLQSLWISQMITNNIKKGGKDEEKRVKAEVDCFEDERVLKVLIEKIECKKEAFKSQTIEEYRSEIRDKIKLEKKNNIDIIRLIILKYAYFLRNKFFHAERWPAHFLIDNDNLKELNKVSLPLTLICVDLLNQYQLKNMN